MGCEDSGSGDDSFSIIGTWEWSWRSTGETNWNPTGQTYQFNSDGTYIYTYDNRYGTGSNKSNYYFCESSNVLQFTSSTGNCSCKTTTSISSFQITLDGTDTFYLSECNNSFQHTKLVKQ